MCNRLLQSLALKCWVTLFVGLCCANQDALAQSKQITGEELQRAEALIATLDRPEGYEAPKTKLYRSERVLPHSLEYLRQVVDAKEQIPQTIKALKGIKQSDRITRASLALCMLPSELFAVEYEDTFDGYVALHEYSYYDTEREQKASGSIILLLDKSLGQALQAFSWQGFNYDKVVQQYNKAKAKLHQLKAEINQGESEVAPEVLREQQAFLRSEPISPGSDVPEVSTIIKYLAANFVIDKALFETPSPIRTEFVATLTEQGTLREIVCKMPQSPLLLNEQLIRLMVNMPAIKPFEQDGRAVKKRVKIPFVLKTYNLTSEVIDAKDINLSPQRPNY